MELDKKLKYLVACSYGPDSMALLTMCIQQGFSVQVAHVNYHKRDESDFEENSLKSFCEEHNIKCHVLDTTGLTHKGNFQAWAREIRYKFFKQIVDREKLDAVLVAHQEDDVIETFLMQQKRNAEIMWYGIAKESKIFGVKVIRPLLNYSKENLLKFNAENNVKFSIDCTNLSSKYTRNKYRHEIVEKLSVEQRRHFVDEIQKLNENKKPIENIQNKWDLLDFMQENEGILIQKISAFCQQFSKFKRLSVVWLKMVKKCISSNKPCVEIRVFSTISIFKEYDEVYLINKTLYCDYEYLIEKPGKYSFDFVDFESSENDADRNIEKTSYPLTIKPAKFGKKYQIKNYESKVSRLYVDWKMPRHLRDWWPGVYDKNNNLIYIPRFRKNFSDSHKITFIIKFPQF